MSVIYCEGCDTHVDTDFNAGHFDECKAPHPFCKTCNYEVDNVDWHESNTGHVVEVDS